jgi:hypothetical protein
MKRFHYHILVLSLGLLCGCNNAPRDNPLDPLSPQHVSTASVTGTAVILNQNTPLASANILSIEDGVTTTTDDAGAFTFENLTAGIQTLVCSKENYSPDTQRVVLQSKATAQVNFSLNGAPYVLAQNIYTRKIDQYYPSPQYFVDITATVTDPNGIIEIDSVWFVVDTLLVIPMAYVSSTPTTRLCQATIYKYDLPTNTTQWLVNKPLHIRSRDWHGAINTSSAFYVSRIIENTATPVYPTINTSTSIKDTTGTTPLLQWTVSDVTFHYTYSFSIALVVSGI